MDRQRCKAEILTLEVGSEEIAKRLFGVNRPIPYRSATFVAARELWSSTLLKASL